MVEKKLTLKEMALGDAKAGNLDGVKELILVSSLLRDGALNNQDKLELLAVAHEAVIKRLQDIPGKGNPEIDAALQRRLHPSLQKASLYRDLLEEIDSDDGSLYPV
jgi:hypothetical protein